MADDRTMQYTIWQISTSIINKSVWLDYGKCYVILNSKYYMMYIHQRLKHTNINKVWCTNLTVQVVKKYTFSRTSLHTHTHTSTETELWQPTNGINACPFWVFFAHLVSKSVEFFFLKNKHVSGVFEACYC